MKIARQEYDSNITKKSKLARHLLQQAILRSELWMDWFFKTCSAFLFLVIENTIKINIIMILFYFKIQY